LCFCLAVCENNSPIIGILTQPSTGGHKSYIAASYVKFIESAGARVVPIFHNAPVSELKALFSSINGILFPGGGADLGPSTPIYKAAKFMYDLALQANDNGDYFPLQGHCMGFQILSLMTSQNASLLAKTELENTSIPLNYYNGYKDSRLFKHCPQEIIDILGKEKVTLNNHHFGVTPADFQANPSLPNFYKLLSWNDDIYSKTFISTMEGIKYPVYALQWHAEKPLFEWNTWEDINHSTNSVKSMQYMADFFVSEARKSKHQFPSRAAELAALIYNYPVTFTGPKDSDFTQTYFFDK